MMQVAQMQLWLIPGDLCDGSYATLESKGSLQLQIGCLTNFKKLIEKMYIVQSMNGVCLQIN